ncbi:MAG: TolC family protein [Phycisphaerae bacterium]|nr:TolC family protein [Phycisphaerae bacterium]
MLAIAAGLSGCAGDRSATGRRIVSDLERDRIAVPDDAGRTQSADTGADLPASGPITLADLLRVAEARSPRLASARSGVGMAAGQRWQASLYPNPRADVAAEDISLRDGASGAKTTIGLTQPIVIAGRLGAAEDAARAEQAAREAEVELRRRELFGEIAFEHARLLSIAAQRRLHEELRRLADRTLDAAQARFDARAAPETDVIRPRIERHRIDAALGRLGHEHAAAKKRVSLLLGGVDVDADRLDPAPLATPIALDAEALEATVRRSHPALALQDREIDAAAARLARVRAERTPDLDVRVAAGYRGEEDDTIVEIGAGMALPLWDAGRATC